MIAVNALDAAELPGRRRRPRAVNDALRSAASVLGNTLAVCRKSYVHPGVVSAFLAGTLKPRRSRVTAAGLRAHERRTLAVLVALEKAAKAEAARRSRFASRAGARCAGARCRRRSSRQ
jgi:DNA topoisomerase-1